MLVLLYFLSLFFESSCNGDDPFSASTSFLSVFAYVVSWTANVLVYMYLCMCVCPLAQRVSSLCCYRCLER